MPARSAPGSATERHDRGKTKNSEVVAKYKRIDRELVQRGSRVTVQRVGHQVTHGLPLPVGWGLMPRCLAGGGWSPSLRPAEESALGCWSWWLIACRPLMPASR